MDYSLLIMAMVCAAVVVAPVQLAQAALAAVWLAMAGGVLWSLGSWLFQL